MSSYENRFSHQPAPQPGFTQRSIGEGGPNAALQSLNKHQAELMAEILSELMLAAKNIRLYPAGNSLISFLTSEASRLLNDTLSINNLEAITLSVVKNELYINDTLLGENDVAEAGEELVDLLKNHSIKNCSFRPGITEPEIRRFLTYLVNGCKEGSSPEYCRQFLTKSGVTHIEIPRDGHRHRPKMPRLDDNRLKVLGEFLKHLLAASENVRIYPAGNPMIADTVNRAHQTLQNLFKTLSGVINFSCSDSALLVNETPVAQTMAGPAARTLARYIRDNNLRSISINKDIFAPELERFLRIMNKLAPISGAEPIPIRAPSEWNRILYKNAIINIKMGDNGSFSAILRYAKIQNKSAATGEPVEPACSELLQDKLSEPVYVNPPSSPEAAENKPAWSEPQPVALPSSKVSLTTKDTKNTKSTPPDFVPSVIVPAAKPLPCPAVVVPPIGASLPPLGRGSPAGDAFGGPTAPPADDASIQDAADITMDESASEELPEINILLNVMPDKLMSRDFCLLLNKLSNHKATASLEKVTAKFMENFRDNRIEIRTQAVTFYKEQLLSNISSQLQPTVIDQALPALIEAINTEPDSAIYSLLIDTVAINARYYLEAGNYEPLLRILSAVTAKLNNKAVAPSRDMMARTELFFGALKQNPAFRTLIDNIKKKETHNLVKQILVKFGLMVVSDLLKIIQSTPERLSREELMGALNSLGPEAQKLFLDELAAPNQPDENLCRLIELAPLVALPEVNSVLEKFILHRSPAVRETTLKNIRKLPKDNALKILLPLLKNKDTGLVTLALEILADLNYREALNEIAALLVTTGDDMVRENCCVALGKLKDGKAVPILNGILSRKSVLGLFGGVAEDVRNAATWALRQCGTTTTVTAPEPPQKKQDGLEDWESALNDPELDKFVSKIHLENNN